MANKMKLDITTTQEIADELSQRLEDVSAGISPPINRVDCWLMAIANAALNGFPIIGRGIEVSNKRRNAQAQIAKEASIKSEKQATENKYFDKTIAVANKIRDLTDGELEEFIAKIREIKHIQKNMSQTVSLLKNRKLPNFPLERVTVIEIAIEFLSLK